MNELALARFVRPRVLDRGSDSDEPVRIEDALERRLEQRWSTQVFLHGPPGSGRRTALEYARLYFEGRSELAFGRQAQLPHEVLLLVSLEAGDHKPLPTEQLELVPWKRDEWIEYLLARHHDQCASVMARLGSPEEELEFKGRPLLWAAILDELALDPELPGAFEALRRAVRRCFSSPAAYEEAARRLWLSLSPTLDAVVARELRELVASEPQAAPFLEQGCVHLLMGAEHVADALERTGECRLPRHIPATFLRAVRPLLGSRPPARANLARLMGSRGGAGTGESAVDEPGAPVPSTHASTASLLHLFGPTAVTDVLRKLEEEGANLPGLSGAQLEGLAAPGANLREVRLETARLVGARLDGAELGRARLDRADLHGASLRGAKLVAASARNADLTEVDLRGACLDDAVLTGAHLREARIESALLRRAQLEGAQLVRALLDRTSLANANLRAANLAEASLIDTDLTGAILDGIDLRAVRLETTLLAGASLIGCNLEEMRLDGPDLSIADLRDAHLTGSQMPGADLRGARLGGAGLARIEWPGANLREADLTDASFHLGSSRSGLLLTAPAGWGSRTSFYTDELRDSSFKRAEIRKADLRRADLRGARIFDTDFYLVDLRGALYTEDQARHLRACGAIL